MAPGVAAALACAGLVASNPAHAADEVLKYAATDDAYVSSARPDYVFGTHTTLASGGLAGDRMISYVRFVVGDVPAGAHVAQAQLRIMRDTRAWPASVKVKQVASSGWSENTVDWLNRPAVGDDLAAAQPAPLDAEVRFDLTGVVRGAGTYTFAVTSPATDDFARFYSHEYGWQGPKLFLTLAGPSPAPSPTPEPAKRCVAGVKLVPTCGVLFGAAAGGFSDTPRDQALKDWEQKAGRTATVYHTYHRGDELFPTSSEIAMTEDAARPRTLMLNWKVDYGTTWAQVAAGGQDARIDRLAGYITTHFMKPFFLVLHHEPENDVNPTAGSGKTARDYAAMYRHTVLRLKADGVTNAVFVMAYMNYEPWNNTSWWGDLYPGDDVVDWVGVDTYANAQPGGFHTGDFASTLTRTTDPARFPGWYAWATTNHPGKPLMVAEWGVYDTSASVDPSNKAATFDSVLPELATMPAIKGFVSFDTAADQAGHDIRIDSAPETLTAFQRLAADPRFDVDLPSVSN